ncbi:SHC-transforming protein 4 isoform X4 [Chelonia mydas]|uniref:SHC-transforming protein 4 isoform X4 n=2 Tax=Chelonia mydas TaxID=8469 RepID=UPI0018A1FB8A|nr:SHC-transforming protein 4 isoform X4 [Chelonia mydas]
MRERSQHSLSGHVLYVGRFRHPGMLHRAKYSRFRDEFITSLEEGTQSSSLNIKGSSSSSHSSTPHLPVEDVTLGTQDSSTTWCTLIPRMANIKLSNPSNLPGFKNFCLGTKEVPRIKLTECVTVPSSPTSPEISLISCLPTSYPRQDPDKLDVNTKPQDDCILLGFESAPLSKQDKPPVQSGGDIVKTGMTYCVRTEAFIQEETVMWLTHLKNVQLYCICFFLSLLLPDCVLPVPNEYMGCIEVLQSMRSLDFGTRTQVTREAISRLCEAVSGTNGAIKKRKPPVKFLSSVLGKSNLQFSGMNIKLIISMSSLTLMNVDTQQIIANHHMQSISFASGGDPDTTDYVAYVAKDPVNQRACHILECPNGMAQDVINTIGQAFELRFKQYLKNPSTPITSNESEMMNLDGSAWNIQEKEDHEYYNEIPGKEPPTGGLLDTRIKVQTDQRANCPIQCEKQYCLAGGPKCINIYENCPEENKSVELPEAVQQRATTNLDSACVLPQIQQQLRNEDCYHGKLNRKAAETLLVNDGDFLVRESATSPGQYVLSGLQGGQAKHLLLVDPEGKVRTKDHVFDSVGHLIRYHMENNLPIISSGSEVSLKQPVRKQSNTGHMQYNK